MNDLESLLNDLANLDAQNDLEAMKSVRQKIVDNHLDTDEAVEAIYKLGLDFLFRQRDVNAAIQSFSTAVTRKHPYWSPAARTSLGLCYYHQDKRQRAVMELRRVGLTAEPSPHSVAALAFLEDIFLRENDAAEAGRTRKQRLSQLEILAGIKDGGEEEAVDHERGYYLYQLAIVYLDQNEKAKATAVLLQAKAAGSEVLGEDLYRAVIDEL